MNEFVQIEVFNVLGQKVVTLVNELQIPGQYQYTWNGKNGYGRALQSGIYFVMIKHTTGIEISKVTFLK
jgi:flagellar hook assembly protein FlgD